jgi:succinate dehydrogenase/fumarate reductase cytochrome b subunit
LRGLAVCHVAHLLNGLRGVPHDLGIVKLDACFGGWAGEQRA